MAVAPIFGTAQKCVVMPPASVPMKHTRSACATIRLALSREYEPTTPTDSGWMPGMVSLPFSEVATGMPSFSASATTSRCAPEARTPPPATITGRAAFCSNCSALITLPRSGSGRNGGTCANNGSHSGSMSASS